MFCTQKCYVYSIFVSEYVFPPAHNSRIIGLKPQCLPHPRNTLLISMGRRDIVLTIRVVPLYGHVGNLRGKVTPPPLPDAYKPPLKLVFYFLVPTYTTCNCIVTCSVGWLIWDLTSHQQLRSYGCDKISSIGIKKMNNFLG